uniref:Predicted nucleic acid-binding protein, contains PIN domain n=1 Tax=Candidatus Kentrum sp. FM TaxID=2126340 RepID=A0A450TYS9_9GAMM|nr:MAG: Predicted nucleic acid-binding protein, contains PIN domain [Candidatus Kentron sp. FM]VFJ75825.1 MAG: Predicted nucleic acid-binding protein, contains PIN domain [Candidatus Kentron sp. FM]VFK22852.1 MAG: Predicted nucleic acid-binding protein, contains PIN domain [Candidatus Kentron sp. FM]
MKEKVYIDSTIPSYYFDRRESLATFAEITRKWWSEMAGEYELFVSDAVIDELESGGDYPNKEEVLALVSEIPQLQLFDDLDRIVEFYVANYVMPKTLAGDAAHLAYASYHNMEYLLTWNCNHLANANKHRHIQVINARLGLATPKIITPLELFREEKNP